MTIRKVIQQGCWLSVGLLTLLAPGAMPQSIDRLNAGLFSASQAARGREAFLDNCMDCHELGEFTGPGAFLDSQQGESLWEIYEFIWAEMPEDRPAWLEPEEYADILSYILSVYGYPAGGDDLPVEQSILESVLVSEPPR